jgi:hypothetical protein
MIDESQNCLIDNSSSISGGLRLPTIPASYSPPIVITSPSPSSKFYYDQSYPIVDNTIAQQLINAAQLQLLMQLQSVGNMNTSSFNWYNNNNTSMIYSPSSLLHLPTTIINNHNMIGGLHGAFVPPTIKKTPLM